MLTWQFWKCNSYEVNQKNLKALKKIELVVFPRHILPCKQNYLQYTTLHTTNTHCLRRWDQSLLHKTPTIIGVWKWGIWESPAAPIVCPILGHRHQHVTQCCANIQPSFRGTNICRGFLWILINVAKYIFKNLKKILKKLQDTASIIKNKIPKLMSSHWVALKIKLIYPVDIKFVNTTDALFQFIWTDL